MRTTQSELLRIFSKYSEERVLSSYDLWRLRTTAEASGPKAIQAQGISGSSTFRGSSSRWLLSGSSRRRLVRVLLRLRWVCIWRVRRWVLLLLMVLGRCRRGRRWVLVGLGRVMGLGRVSRSRSRLRVRGLLGWVLVGLMVGWGGGVRWGLRGRGRVWGVVVSRGGRRVLGVDVRRFRFGVRVGRWGRLWCRVVVVWVRLCRRW